MMTRIALALVVFSLGCSGNAKDRSVVQRLEAAKRVKAREATKQLVVTAIPDENPDELQRKNRLLADYLEKKMGVEIEFKPVTNYGAAVRALVAGQVDFAWLGGYTFVQAQLQAGAVPVVMRESDLSFKSVFVAHKDSGIASMADLKGKTFAFGSKSSTSGRLMPEHFMKRKFGLDPAKDLKGRPVYSGAHDATLRMVNTGQVDAGALNSKTWEKNRESAPNVGVIWETPGYVDYVWAASPSVSANLRDKFKDAFVALDETNHGALLSLQRAKKYVPADPALWRTIESVAREAGLIQ